jgi:hypothetical protein
METADRVREFNSCYFFPAGDWLTFVEISAIASFGTQPYPNGSKIAGSVNSIDRLGIGQVTALPRIAEIENQSDCGPSEK